MRIDAPDGPSFRGGWAPAGARRAALAQPAGPIAAGLGGAGAGASAEPAGIDVGVLLRTLRRRLYILVGMLVLGIALGVVVQSHIKPRYTSSVEVLLDPKRSDSFGAETQFGSIYVDSAKIASVVSIIESSDLLGRVVQQLRLQDDPDFGGPPKPGLRQRIALLFGKAPPVAQDSAERALAQLEKAVRAERVGMTYVLTISAVAAHPALARDIAEAVAEAYLEDQVEIKSTATQRDATWLSDRLHAASGLLLHSEEKVEAIRHKFGLLEIDKGTTLDQQSIADLNAQLLKARADVATQKAHYEQVTRIRAAGGSLDVLPEVAASRVIESLRTTLAGVDENLAHLKAVYQPGFSEIRRLTDYRTALQGEIDAEVGRIVAGIRTEYDSAVAREQELTQELQQASSDEKGAHEAEGRVQLRDAQRAVQLNLGLYESLANRLREVQQQETREDPEARIISRAALPNRPSFPKPLLIPLGSAVVFLMLGLVITVGPPLFENRFVGIDDVERRLGLPVLGALPVLRRKDVARARGEAALADQAAHLSLSRFAENLRMVRAYLRIAADGAPAVIQLTSAVGGEGKSTLAAAFAVSAASAGVRTALLDVDLRCASLSEMFAMRGAPGLTDVLDGAVTLRTALHELADVPLAVLGTGSATLPRPDVIDSNRFGALLREVAAEYHLIILDGPPILPVSDGLMISRYADATILVVQWRATARKLVGQAAKMLRMVDAPLIGVVLNKIDFALTDRHEYEKLYRYYRRSTPVLNPPVRA